MPGEAQSFLNEMQSEVFERSSGNDGSAPDFKENVFTEYVMELLAGEVGIVESPEACHLLKEINRGQAKINGFAIDEDAQGEESIDLFISVYKGFAEVTAVPAAAMKKAAEHAVRYLGWERLIRSTQSSILHSRSIRWPSGSTRSGPRPEAREHLRSDGRPDALSRCSRSRSLFLIKDSPTQLRVVFWDVERLARVVGSGRPQSEIEIDLIAMNGEPLAVRDDNRPGG